MADKNNTSYWLLTNACCRNFIIDELQKIGDDPVWVSSGPKRKGQIRAKKLRIWPLVLRNLADWVQAFYICCIRVEQKYQCARPVLKRFVLGCDRFLGHGDRSLKLIFVTTPMYESCSFNRTVSRASWRSAAALGKDSNAAQAVKIIMMSPVDPIHARSKHLDLPGKAQTKRR